MNNRYAQFNIICGTNGTGKSTLAAKILQASPLKNGLVYIEAIDTHQGAFAKYPVVAINDYRGGKVLIDADTVEFHRFLDIVCEHYRNGVLMIDEAGLYKMFENSEPIEPVKLLLKQRRKYNIDIYFIYHSVSEIPVKLFKWVNNLILFHQTDKFNHKGAVIPRLDELNQMKDRIAEQYYQGNKFYNEYLNLS